MNHSSGLTALVIIALTAGTPALAAPPVPYNWTGFYVGGNIGYGWGNSNLSLVPGSTWGTGGGQYLVDNGSPNLTDRGVLGGVQAGYNFQQGNLVYGVEADFSFANINGSRNTGAIEPPTGVPVAARTFSESDKLDWLITTRGRLGYAVQNTLLYVTGGLAIGHRKFTQDVTAANGFNQNFGSTSSTKAGWTLGAGAEYALSRNWSIKGEYLYVDLGSVSVSSDSNTSPGAGLTVDTSSKMTVNIARLGVNYKFP